MGKNKLARWNELGTFSKVFQPEIGAVAGKDHPVKGTWKTLIFGNMNPVVLELGCGKGEYTVGLATRFPDNNYIGVDIKGARMWRGAKTANEQKLPNVAFLRTRIEFISSKKRQIFHSIGSKIPGRWQWLQFRCRHFEGVCRLQWLTGQGVHWGNRSHKPH